MDEEALPALCPRYSGLSLPPQLTKMDEALLPFASFVAPVLVIAPKQSHGIMGHGQCCRQPRRRHTLMPATATTTTIYGNTFPIAQVTKLYQRDRVPYGRTRTEGVTVGANEGRAERVPS